MCRCVREGRKEEVNDSKNERMGLFEESVRKPVFLSPWRQESGILEPRR